MDAHQTFLKYRMNTGFVLRAVLADIKGSDICEQCKTQKATVVHHKDKNRENNTVANLELVCQSCHLSIHRKIGRTKGFPRTSLKPSYRAMYGYTLPGEIP